jgi:hypothetical protein
LIPGVILANDQRSWYGLIDVRRKAVAFANILFINVVFAFFSINNIECVPLRVLLDSSTRRECALRSFLRIKKHCPTITAVNHLKNEAPAGRAASMVFVIDRAESPFRCGEFVRPLRTRWIPTSPESRERPEKEVATNGQHGLTKSLILRLFRACIQNRQRMILISSELRCHFFERVSTLGQSVPQLPNRRARG